MTWVWYTSLFTFPFLFFFYSILYQLKCCITPYLWLKYYILIPVSLLSTSLDDLSAHLKRNKEKKHSKGCFLCLRLAITGSQAKIYWQTHTGSFFVLKPLQEKKKQRCFLMILLIIISDMWVRELDIFLMGFVTASSASQELSNPGLENNFSWTRLWALNVCRMFTFTESCIACMRWMKIIFLKVGLCEYVTIQLNLTKFRYCIWIITVQVLVSQHVCIPSPFL